MSLLSIRQRQAPTGNVIPLTTNTSAVSPRLRATWAVNPETGRLTATWQAAPRSADRRFADQSDQHAQAA